MMVFIGICLGVLSGLVYWMIYFSQYQNTLEWFQDFNNRKKFTKHFMGEGVQAHVFDFANLVNFSFSHKNQYVDMTVSLKKAKKIFDLTSDGGIRVLLLELNKIG